MTLWERDCTVTIEVSQERTHVGRVTLGPIESASSQQSYTQHSLEMTGSSVMRHWGKNCTTAVEVCWDISLSQQKYTWEAVLKWQSTYPWYW